MKLNWGIIPFPRDDHAFQRPRKNLVAVTGYSIYFSFQFLIVHTFRCQNLNKQATTGRRTDRFGTGRMPHVMTKTYVIYPSECLFIFSFLVQCVNAKAMSWLSMVEYRDLCKLFFKLKIKKGYYTDAECWVMRSTHTKYVL